jgi:hypothetical protein
MKEGINMSQSNQKSEYEYLYNLYSNKSDKELSDIIKPENGYTQEAIKVASDILYSDRTSYYEKIKQQQEQAENSQKIDKDELFFEMRNDIHSIKNMVLFFVILTVIYIVCVFYAVFVAIPNLF